MALDEDVKLYPRGVLALGTGDLMQVTNVKHVFKNNAKLVHTIRRTPSGVTTGTHDTTLDFDAVCDEDGFERDFLKSILNGTIKEFRIKVPGETISVKGVATERSLELPLDDAIKYSINVIGKTQKT
jgi:hypothetical protein